MSKPLKRDLIKQETDQAAELRAARIRESGKVS